MTLSKNSGSFPDDWAHAIRTRATAAAARMTRAYSAVVWPPSRLSENRPTFPPSRSDRTAALSQVPTRSEMPYMASPPFFQPRSAERADRGQHDRPYGEEEERGKD